MHPIAFTARYSLCYTCIWPAFAQYVSLYMCVCVCAHVQHMFLLFGVCLCACLCVSLWKPFPKRRRWEINSIFIWFHPNIRLSKEEQYLSDGRFPALHPGQKKEKRSRWRAEREEKKALSNHFLPSNCYLVSLCLCVRGSVVAFSGLCVWGNVCLPGSRCMKLCVWSKA